MPKDILIAQGTAAGTHQQAFPANCSIVADGDLSTDEVTFEIVGPSGGLTTAYDADGVALILTGTKPNISLFAPIELKITKPLTTNEVGIYLQW